MIESFQAEADAVVAEARAEADSLRAEGERQARELLGGLAMKVAAKESETAAESAERDQPEASRIDRATNEIIAQLRARAAIEIPQLVDAAIDAIWLQIPSDPTSGSPR